MKKYLFTILSIVLSFVFSTKLFAATTILDHVPASAAQQEQFYVDVKIDADGKSFNAVQGGITFSTDTLSFVRAETGTSNITTFIDQPTLHGNTISFSGIIPGGFNGLTNPFDPSNKGPAEIVRLVFVGKTSGNASISSSMTVADNDGQGTLEKLPNVSSTLTVSNSLAPSVYKTADTIAPIITASVVTDKNLYNGQYTLIFTATDKQSGIDYVELQEGNSEWKVIQSPYVLHDQSRHSILSLRAYDVAGNVTNITIDSIASSTSTPTAVIVIIILALLLISSYVIYKKNHHNNISQ